MLVNGKTKEPVSVYVCERDWYFMVTAIPDKVFAAADGNLIYICPQNAPFHSKPKVQERLRVAAIMQAIALQSFPNDRASAMDYADLLERSLTVEDRAMLASIVNSDLTRSVVVSPAYASAD